MKSIFCHKAKAAPPAANTLRFEFGDQNYSPVTAGVGSSGTWKRCEFMPGNVWDWTNPNNSWANIFQDAFRDYSNIVKIIDSETSHITGLFRAFQNCSSLKEISPIDASSCLVAPNCFWGCTMLEEIVFENSTLTTNFQDFARGCSSLKKVPKIKTNSASTVTRMFYQCRNVESGALELYTQMSGQTTPPTAYTDCFYQCGSDTITGANELSQIPTSWGGTMEEV